MSYSAAVVISLSLSLSLIVSSFVFANFALPLIFSLAIFCMLVDYPQDKSVRTRCVHRIECDFPHSQCEWVCVCVGVDVDVDVNLCDEFAISSARLQTPLCRQVRGQILLQRHHSSYLVPNCVRWPRAQTKVSPCRSNVRHRRGPLF